MVTLVGMQKSFDNAIIALYELEFSALASYQAAIERLEKKEFTDKISEFEKDHQNHLEELKKIIKTLGHNPPDGSSLKEYITKGKVILANLIGDKTILMALKTNEDDTNAAYKRMTGRTDKPEEIEAFLEKGLEDERKHRLWLETTLEELS